MAAAIALGLLVWAGLSLRTDRLEWRFMATMPDQLSAQADLVRFGVASGRPVFDRACAGCHGADMKGARGQAVPDLAAGDWLYGDGSVSSVERTVLYGIRSTNGKTRAVAEMPAFGLRGQLGPAGIDALVQYVLQLGHRPANADAARTGRALFEGSASCADCHGADGTGNPDYGAPNLADGLWIYGGDPASLYRTIFSGRHGIMPAYMGRLSPFQIRAVAVYVHANTRHHTAS